MKHISVFRKIGVIGLLTAIVLGIFVFGPPSTEAARDTARVVKYSQNDVVPVKAKLRFSTLIILPEKEEILDFTTGDKEFWIINGAHNLCYVHPGGIPRLRDVTRALPGEDKGVPKDSGCCAITSLRSLRLGLSASGMTDAARNGRGAG